MNTAFFGTSGRSKPILESLKKNFDLMLCVTKPNSDIEAWAKQNRVKCLTVNKFDAVTVGFVNDQLIDSTIELGVVADFSFILPQKILSVPKYKFINIHFSILPRYRGASPVQFAILNGDKETGITYYIMDTGIDTGAIVCVIKYKLTGSETSGELYKTLFGIAAENLPKIITNYKSGKARLKKQDNNLATYTYSKTHPKSTFIYKGDARINWLEDLSVVKRQIRAFNPWPMAWSTLEDIAMFKNKTLLPNKNGSLRVKFLTDKILRVEGGKNITWNDLENGYFAPTSSS